CMPFVKFKIWSQAGSISFAMLPIFIVAFRWGVKGGLLAGFIWGVLQIPLGGLVYHPVQAFIDYTLALTVLGFAGIFAKRIQQAVTEDRPKGYCTYIISGIFLGSLLRFAAHVVAGVAFFAEFMPEGWDNIWLYSFVFNVSYIIPSFLLCALAIFFLFNKQPKIVLQTDA